MAEEWRAVEDFPFYDVSSHGRIRSWQSRNALLPHIRRARPVTLSQKTSKAGYREVCLSRNGGRAVKRVHRLVLSAFHGQPPSGDSQGAHLNGRRDDNRRENLVWATPVVNSSHRALHGTVIKPQGRIGDEKRRAIAALAVAGFTDAEIERVLAVTPRTVKRHSGR